MLLLDSHSEGSLRGVAATKRRDSNPRSIMKTVFCFVFFLSSFALLFTGCKKSEDSVDGHVPNDSNQKITINIVNEPHTLDPRRVRLLPEINIIRMFMEGLTRVGRDGAVSLALARDVAISDDLKTYTFTLREAKWSNGNVVTSRDFAYAWKKSLSPEFNAPNAGLLYLIKNAKEAKCGKLPLSLVGIETPDLHTLVVELNYATPYFLEMLSHPIFFAVSSVLDRANPHWAESSATYVGNGPFTLSSWRHHDEICALKSGNYWDKEVVKIGEIKMVMASEGAWANMFDSSELSWGGSPFSSISFNAMQDLKLKGRLRSAPFLATKWICINLEREPFQSKNLRKALAFAIDRQSIAEHITQGTQIPATGIVPQTMGLQPQPLLADGDVPLAQSLFNEFLEEGGNSLDTLPSIGLTYVSSERNRIMAQAVQQQWHKAFGIQIVLEPVESKVFVDRVSKKDYGLALRSWVADFDDPISFLDVFRSKSAEANSTSWENAKYTELLEASSYCRNSDDRKAFLARSEQIFMDDMAVIPLLHLTMLYVKADHLKDVVFTPLGDVDFKYAHVEG